uniref:FHA domain-containing protein n=1 Tax=uncultured Chloroflexota bacterium TaxID=166587 RepID=H5SN22_9CHLR|nr:FHA domain-containing protein [uncultured Chloroflexota bacterium]
MAKLIIYEDLNDTETIFEDFELVTSRILIGSSHDNHLVLDTPEVDPTHASLELRDEHWVLQDLGGPGGTVVNGQHIAGPYRLKDGDLIELGGVKMRFQADEPTVETEPVPAEVHLSGRVWFATIAGGTLAIIFIILLLLIIADYLGFLRIVDLIPFWSG